VERLFKGEAYRLTGFGITFNPNLGERDVEKIIWCLVCFGVFFGDKRFVVGSGNFCAVDNGQLCGNVACGFAEGRIRQDQNGSC
jgi:hypothetical protein